MNRGGREQVWAGGREKVLCKRNFKNEHPLHKCAFQANIEEMGLEKLLFQLFRD